MIPMRAFRADPHFADLFAHVHVICWPILWWQLNALFRWCKREGRPDVLYSVNAWGFITLRHAGDRHDPATYQRPERTFRPLTDASWGGSVPLDLGARSLREAICAALILPCEAGAFRDQRSHGDRPGKESMTLFANTS